MDSGLSCRSFYRSIFRFPFYYFDRPALTASMCIDGHCYRLFEGLEEDQGYTDQREDPDDQIHAVIGDEHGLFGDDAFHRPVGHLFCIDDGLALGYKSLRSGGVTLHIGGVIRVEVFQQ